MARRARGRHRLGRGAALPARGPRLPVVRWALETARRHEVPTVLNPAPVQPLGDEILALVDYLTPNEGEAGALTGRPSSDLDSAREAAERLARAGRRPRPRHPGRAGRARAATATPRSTFPAFPVRRSTPPPRATRSTARSRSASPRAATLEQADPARQRRRRARVHEARRAGLAAVPRRRRGLSCSRSGPVAIDATIASQRRGLEPATERLDAGDGVEDSLAREQARPRRRG